MTYGRDRTAPRRGVAAWLPAEGVADMAAKADLDFVAIDLVGGPIDEIALQRVAAEAHGAGLDVIAIAEPPAERATQLGVDVVVAPDADELAVLTDPADPTAGARYVAIDTRAALASLLATFAARGQVHSPLSVVMLPGTLGTADAFGDVVTHLGPAAPCRPCRTDLDDSLGAAADSVLASVPGRFALAGHSLGGIVALEVWRRAPDRVAGLALLNTSARAPSEAQVAAWSEQRARTESGEFDAVAGEQARLTAGRPGTHDGDLVDRCVAMAHSVGPDGFLRQLGVQVSREGHLDDVSAVSVPTIVVSGSDDEVCPTEIQAELAGAIPGARHVTIDGAGHMAPLDHPAHVARALDAWWHELIAHERSSIA